MFIPSETIDEVRDRSSVEEIAKRYVPSLTKKGRNYVGLCPFHKEKTPSFTVSPERQMFYCFGCQTGGNVFTFISKIERLDFPESVKFVADIIGIEIKPDENPEKYAKFDEIRRLNAYATKFYQKYLKSGSGNIGIDYVRKRGINENSIEQFNIGFAPDSWDVLTGSLTKRNIDLQLAEKIGLVSSKAGNNGKHFYDKFRNRIIFPIYDIKNNTVAFGGRIIGDGNPKYLNSPESEAFKKREILYGLNLARDHIRDLNRAIVVEGYLDVIGCFQSGVNNVVAPLGTSLTSEQVKILARSCGEIILLFDSDSAGINASLRSLDVIDETNVEVKVAILPEGDPFEYISQKGAREFMAIVDSSIKPVDFRIARIMKDYDWKGKINNTLIKLFEIINDIDLETERSIYLKKISSLLNVNENSIRTDFSKFQKNKFKGIPEDKGKKDKSDFITRSYQALIKLLFNYPELMGIAVIDFDKNEITDTISSNIYNKIVEINSSGIEFSIDKIFDFFTEGPEFDYLIELLNAEYIIDDPKSSYNEIYTQLRIYKIDDMIKKTMKLLKESENGSGEYLTEIEVLTREKQKLSHYIYNK